MNCVGGGDRAADQRQIPELNRNVALAPPLRRDPLHDEARSEEKLAEQADEDPEVPGARIEAHDCSAECRMQNAECRLSAAILHSAFCILHFIDPSPCECGNSASSSPSIAPPYSPPILERRDSSRRTSTHRTAARGG